MERLIRIVGAREHNLQNISLELPRDKIIVVTGVSGSGKSSLVFDTIYAEGNRRYVESLSSYARQFLEQIGKPDVDSIEGLPPTIAIDQSNIRSNPRSTVATTTEIYDYLRVLYARIGVPHCPKCKKSIGKQSAEEIVEQIMSLGEGVRVVLLAPLVRLRKGEHKETIAQVKRQGFVRVRVNGEIYDVNNVPSFKKTRKYTIEAVVDRIVLSPDVRGRLTDSVELALRFGEGTVLVSHNAEQRWKDSVFSENYGCAECGVSFEELSPRMFSFNSPYGACPRCHGLGTLMKVDEEMVVPDANLSLQEHAIRALHDPRLRLGGSWTLDYLNRTFSIPLDVPFKELSEEAKEIILYGDRNSPSGRLFEGVITELERRFETTGSEYVKQKIHEYMSELPCPACKGARLRPESLAVTIGDKNIYQFCKSSVGDALMFVSSLKLDQQKQQIAEQVLKAIKSRLQFMVDVGLHYITLERSTGTLSGGEAQRIRLATQIGSGLVGVCYCLDEPTIGLHQHDNSRLLKSLLHLRDLGNTVIMVEHDEQSIRAADFVVDLGPGAGHHGGNLVFAGSVEELCKCERSLTGRYLSGDLTIAVPQRRRELRNAPSIRVIGAREHNLKRISVTFPLGGIVCVAGVSGSGKSTLLNEVLYKALRRKLHNSFEKAGKHDGLVGEENLQRVVEISQVPIGRTPRSNPATYTGAFGYIRQIFAMTKQARLRGFTSSRFSFNVRGGRCEACEGQGTKRIEMHFLPDVYVTCEVCKGKRYNRQTLEVRYRDKTIADVLKMRVEEAVSFFENYPRLYYILKTLSDVGLGYLELGQPSPTLSGGEAQRIKLAAELTKGCAKGTLYIMDEPTIGLHPADIQKLLNVMNRLVEQGGSFIVIEHNLDVLKTADYLIELGPGGGEEGGRVVAKGRPEEVAQNPNSLTGRYLRSVLGIPAEVNF
ncbi:MAG: excinuclease ABC subunit UvrA [Planctomycetota bacterium]|nr:excinuclease ABC subunit UvrA [Planctomycetota bacterium]